MHKLNMRKKYSNSRLRRSKRGKSAKNGKRLRIKTRRMRGRGLFDWFTGSTGSAAGPAGYSAVSQEEPIEFLVKADFTDRDGKKGKYTGHAIDSNGVYSRKDSNGIMDYGNGIKYIGSFDRNMKNGQGTYYDKNIQLTGEWLDDKPVKIIETTYAGTDSMPKTIDIHNRQSYPELLESADAVTGYKGRFDPRSVSAMPTIPTFRPNSIL